MPAWAQEKVSKPPQVITDTIVVRKNSYVVTSDSMFFVDHDTVLYVQDTLKGKLSEILNRQDYKRKKEFYENLKEKASTRKTTRELFNLLFNVSEDSKKPQTDPWAHIPEEYDHKIVGNIYLKQIDIFGPRVTDTTRLPKTKIAVFINNTHINTHDRVIRHNLLLEEGDEISQQKILDNERVLRSLRFIKDARILIQPRSADSDTVDLLVLTQDVMALSGSVEPEGLTAANIHIDHNNLLGMGHALNNAVIIEPKDKQYIGYRGTYEFSNIRGSFVQGNIDYFNTNFENIYRLRLNRDFITPAIRYGGGAEVSYYDRTTLSPLIDSFQAADTFSTSEDLPLINYSYWYQDYWLGRSFIPRFIENNRRSRITLALRYVQTQFDNRPVVLEDSNTAFHNHKRMLASVGFSKRYYTTEQLVFTYGRTEDIPIGYLLELTSGMQLGEFYDRWYTGIGFSTGKYLRRWGYMSFVSQLGGFWKDQRPEEGIVQLGLRSFSYLIHRKRTKYRLFADINYTTGIKRRQAINFQESYINIRDNNGIRGLRSGELEGNQRLTLSLESIAYMPFSLYGFNFAFFTFADVGWISQPGEAIFKSKTFQGYGVGIRVRNENLAFKTFQIRLAVYPIVPEGAQMIGFQIGSIPLPRFTDFNTKRPDIFRFR